MSASTLTLAPYAGLRLVEGAVAVPALASHVRPALVLPERETRAILEAARHNDVSAGGVFSAGPAGVQVWNVPWDGPNGTHGTAQHLGSVDWCYDTPSKHYSTIYRAMVTNAGVAAGETTATIMGRVLELAGVSMDADRLDLPRPPQRDPFRTKRV